ncbi:MAG: molybdate ABC transporter substrate-binding protein [Granulosicoccus sp.]
MLTFCVILPAHASSGPLIAAASSLRSLWPVLAQTYSNDTAHRTPRISFGSSGLLSTQILNGAPFEIFLSADLASIERLPEQSLKSSPRVFAMGELSLVIPKSSPLTGSLSLETLAAALQEQADTGAMRIAIPNPVHAPYGKAAQQALDSAGIWPLEAKRLLTAENAAQTLQFVKTGAVAAAIIPKALVFADNSGIESVDLPADSYRSVEHVVAVLTAAGEPAQAFYHWLLSKEAHEVLEKSGLRVATH